MRSWIMWAHKWEIKGKTSFHHASPNKRWVELFGSRSPIVSVDVVESEQGEYRGWIKTGDIFPSMIHREIAFEVCFTYGSKASVDAGKGVIVNLDIKERLS